MVYLDYTTVNFSTTSSGETTIYTVPYKCVIIAEVNTFLPRTVISNYVARNDSDSLSIVKSIIEYNQFLTRPGGVGDDDVIRTLKSNTQVFESGEVIVSRGWSSINATLHIFRLPESP